MAIGAHSRRYRRRGVFGMHRQPWNQCNEPNGVLLRHLHVGVSQDELAQGVVHREAVDRAALHGHDQLGRGAVHGETGGNQIGARVEQVLLGALCALCKLEDTEDCADRDTCVQVAATVDRIADNSIPRVGVLVEDDRLFHLFRHKHTYTARRLHGRDEDVIADDVQLLLVVTSGVGRAGKTAQVDQGSSPDVCFFSLCRCGNVREVTSRLLVLVLLLSQPPCQGPALLEPLIFGVGIGVFGARKSSTLVWCIQEMYSCKKVVKNFGTMELSGRWVRHEDITKVFKAVRSMQRVKSEDHNKPPRLNMRRELLYAF
ncbi:fructose-1,6-bisphosphatase [Hortaea werneckii]|nr:fructose-1,6-bisphosphatase [Hortaea werneckii]